MNITAGAIVLNGKYRIDAEVGHGAFGVVYRATHLELNVPRAIKMLREDAPGVGSTVFTTYRGRFRNEFQLAARIDHPNLIKVYDFVEEDGALFAVMEYAPGGSLADLLAAKGPLEIEQAARLIRGAAEGLRALHEELEAIHRDVKPNNILLDRAGQAKVADFGLAQVRGFGMSVDSRLSGQAMPHPGTPNYASPEHANGGEPLTPSADVYSLGCVAFELLTGRLWKTQQARARGPRDLRPEVPEWLDALVRRMLLRTPGLTVDDAGDPTKRFVDMRGVLAVLDPQLHSAEQARAGAVEQAKIEAARVERLKDEEAKRLAVERERDAKIVRLREELAAAEGSGQIDAAERVVAAWVALAPNDAEAIAARQRVAVARQRDREQLEVAATRVNPVRGVKDATASNWPNSGVDGRIRQGLLRTLFAKLPLGLVVVAFAIGVPIVLGFGLGRPMDTSRELVVIATVVPARAIEPTMVPTRAVEPTTAGVTTRVPLANLLPTATGNPLVNQAPTNSPSSTPTVAPSSTVVRTIAPVATPTRQSVTPSPQPTALSLPTQIPQKTGGTSPNLLPNPSFEFGSPAGWIPRVQTGDAKLVWDAEVAHTGSHSIGAKNIILAKCWTGELCATFDWMSEQWIVIEPNATYQLSYWFRNTSPQYEFVLFAELFTYGGVFVGYSDTAQLEPTEQWKYRTVTIDMKRFLPREVIAARVWFRGLLVRPLNSDQTVPGGAWIDDISLTAIGQ